VSRLATVWKRGTLPGVGRYRARDLVLVPSLLSLSRVPLALLFPLSIDSPPRAVLVLFLAALTDVADGWYARRHGQATPTGAVVDGLTDKVFVLSVLATLLVVRRLDPLDVLLLSTRELGEVPLVAWWAFSHKQRKLRAVTPAANIPGKLATVLQFGTVAAVTAGVSASYLITATAIVGIIAAALYWIRELTAAGYS
jgi:CDP-diacylglycerol--glycerol-3-phosphate 3-phosphatidyltransferase/cardiolipin synthase